MKRPCKYESPAIEMIAVDTESVFCTSPVFGQEGGPGNDYYYLDDITDGGAF